MLVAGRDFLVDFPIPVYLSGRKLAKKIRFRSLSLSLSRSIFFPCAGLKVDDFLSLPVTQPWACLFAAKSYGFPLVPGESFSPALDNSCGFERLCVLLG